MLQFNFATPVLYSTEILFFKNLFPITLQKLNFTGIEFRGYPTRIFDFAGIKFREQLQNLISQKSNFTDDSDDVFFKMKQRSYSRFSQLSIKLLKRIKLLPLRLASDMVSEENAVKSRAEIISRSADM